MTYQDLTADDIIELSQSINVNSQRIPAVPAGALPTPSEPNSYMVATDVGAYTYGGTTIGTNKYTSAGASARASLVSKGWTITDGGLV